jgi:polyisoprenoid-binding protein YceI
MTPIMTAKGGAGFLLLALSLTASPLAAQRRSYRVDAAASAVDIHVGKAGFFKFAGHEHLVLATVADGQVWADLDDLTRSGVRLRFSAAALKVSDKGEPPADVVKVQAKMIGSDLLDVAHFLWVQFVTTAVAGKPAGGGAYDLSVMGELTLHGISKPLTLPVRVTLSGDTLTASGSAILLHTDFGLTPVSVAGVVKVKNEIAVEYKIVAKADP